MSQSSAAFDRNPTRIVAGEEDAVLAELQAALPVLMQRLRLAVVHGGDKAAPGSVIYPSVNARSWKSYRAVAEDIAQALRRLGFRHVCLLADDMRLGDRLRQERVHLAWLNSGGVQGYNPLAHAPAHLEMLGVPYVGHDPLTAGTLDNKHAFKRDLVCFGLPTAPFITWHQARGAFRPKLNSRFLRTFKDHWGAYVVKPVSGRASLNVHVIDDEAGLPEAVAAVYAATANHVLIEAYLPGREFCVAASGPLIARKGALFRNVEPFVFSAVERVFVPGERIVTSMDVRPITKQQIRVLSPVSDAAEMARLSELGRQVYLDFNLESLVRLDLRCDGAGRMHILEANPKPDLKYPTVEVTNLVCAGLADTGMDYDDLILALLANRLAGLLGHRRAWSGHILELLQ